jgi:MFS family permease
VNAKKQAWAVLGAAFLAGVAVAVNQFKVPPLLPVLMPELGADMATGGWLMSVVSLASLVLAIPTAFLLTRFGLRPTGLVALSFTLSGAVLGALSANVTMLLLARIIEGVGMGLVSVVGPAAVSAWFEPEERGLPMGIWATWVPVGNALAFNLSEPLMQVLGWQAMWWFGALCALLAAIVYALVVTDPQQVPGRPAAPCSASAFGRRLFNPPSWVLALAFATFTFCMLGYNTWAPTYLSGPAGIQPATANFLASLIFLVGLGTNLLAGWVIDRTRDRYRLLAVGFLFGAVLFSWSFSLQAVLPVALNTILLGTVAGFIVTSIFTLAPDTMELPQLASLGVAIAQVGSSVGTLTGPPALGLVIDLLGWPPAGLFLAAVMGVGLVTVVVARRPARSKGQILPTGSESH